MDLNLLSLFARVAESPSFAAAAAKLGVRRSSVSRAVATLERSLGVALFSRTTRRVALTTAGAALYAKVGPQLAALRDAVGTLPEREEEPSGDLRITTTNDLGVVVMSGIAAAFSARYPAIRLEVRLTNRKLDLVAEGFDAALRVSPGSRLADSSLIARKLSDMALHVVASPAYLARAGAPKTLRDGAKHQWVWFPGSKLPSPLPAPAAPPRIAGDDLLFLYDTVKAGAGLSVLPVFLVREAVATGDLVRLFPRVSIRTGTVHFVHPPARHVPRKVKALRDFLVEHFAGHPLADGV